MNNLLLSYDIRLIFASKIKDYGYSPKTIDNWFKDEGIVQFPTDYTTDLREDYIDASWGIMLKSEDQLILEEIYSYLETEDSKDYIIITGRLLPGLRNRQFVGSLAQDNVESRLNDLICS